MKIVIIFCVAVVWTDGQTGSGKTHTIGGGSVGDDSSDIPGDCGFIPRVVSDIFTEAQKLQSDADASSHAFRAEVEMSYMEVYKEDCFDLMAAGRPRLDLRETNKGETTVEGLTRLKCTCASDIHTALREANLGRATSATLMNASSSRSHAVLTVHLKITKQIAMEGEAPESGAGSGSVITLSSRLNVVDLAGSERVKKTGASGDTLKEGRDPSNIQQTNISLVFLSLLFPWFVPYQRVLIPPSCTLQALLSTRVCWRLATSSTPYPRSR